ncbi:MAG: adenine deaminase [Dehalococcoidales bacterium]|jgi:adenine deaminase|nr:adenine deaminase [Dehalococcoidales bacterium]
MSSEKVLSGNIALGNQPADLLLKNARIINVFTGRIERGNVAISGGRIAGIGDYDTAKEVIDLKNRYLAPAFIDGHTHLESSMLDVGEYARAVVPRGTLTVVTDLHEIANVSGLAGIRYYLENSSHLPLNLFLMVPSCVPSSNLETAGAVIGLAEISRLLRLRNCLGLGEVMDYPAVIRGDARIMQKIRLARGKIVDGHAPGLMGRELNAYISAGIMSDHESTSLEEAREKIRRGLWVMVREGSSEKNLETLLPLLAERTFYRCMLVVDDRNCLDLFKDGDIDAVVRRAIRLGLDPIRAIQAVTINPATYFRLRGLGAIAPGYRADLVVIENLSELGIDRVFFEGRLVAEKGKALFSPVTKPVKDLESSVKLAEFGEEDLKLPAGGDTFPVIEIIPGQIITRRRDMTIIPRNRYLESDTERDILKLVVVERHHATGHIGKGLVSGLGLKKGALATSIAHDAHNIVAAGVSDHEIMVAIREIERMQGGLVAVQGDEVLAALPLPVGGLLSRDPLERVVDKMAKLEECAHLLGSGLDSIFSTLSFLALPVIPELRLTDLGVVDVNASRIIA